jgi:hypothetical protein
MTYSSKDRMHTDFCTEQRWYIAALYTTPIHSLVNQYMLILKPAQVLFMNNKLDMPELLAEKQCRHYRLPISIVRTVALLQNRCGKRVSKE